MLDNACVSISSVRNTFAMLFNCISGVVDCMVWRSFITQCFHGIDAGRPSCRKRTGEQRGGPEKKGDADKGNRIEWTEAVQNRAQNERQPRRTKKPGDHACGDEAHAFPYDHSQNAAPLCAEGHSDAEFLSSLRHG